MHDALVTNGGSRRATTSWSTRRRRASASSGCGWRCTSAPRRDRHVAVGRQASPARRARRRRAVHRRRAGRAGRAAPRSTEGHGVDVIVDNVGAAARPTTSPPPPSADASCRSADWVGARRRSTSTSSPASASPSSASRSGRGRRRAGRRRASGVGRHGRCRRLRRGAPGRPRRRFRSPTSRPPTRRSLATATSASSSSSRDVPTCPCGSARSGRFRLTGRQRSAAASSSTSSRWAPTSGPAIGRWRATRPGRRRGRRRAPSARTRRACRRGRSRRHSARARGRRRRGAADLRQQWAQLVERRRVEVGDREPQGPAADVLLQPGHVLGVAVLQLGALVQAHDRAAAPSPEPIRASAASGSAPTACLPQSHSSPGDPTTGTRSRPPSRHRSRRTPFAPVTAREARAARSRSGGRTVVDGPPA